jgi:hypothetical protein
MALGEGEGVSSGRARGCGYWSSGVQAMTDAEQKAEDFTARNRRSQLCAALVCSGLVCCLGSGEGVCVCVLVPARIDRSSRERLVVQGRSGLAWAARANAAWRWIGRVEGDELTLTARRQRRGRTTSSRSTTFKTDRQAIRLTTY